MKDFGDIVLCRTDCHANKTTVVSEICVRQNRRWQAYVSSIYSFACIYYLCWRSTQTQTSPMLFSWINEERFFACSYTTLKHVVCTRGYLFCKQDAKKWTEMCAKMCFIDALGMMRLHALWSEHCLHQATSTICNLCCSTNDQKTKARSLQNFPSLQLTYITFCAPSTISVYDLSTTCTKPTTLRTWLPNGYGKFWSELTHKWQFIKKSK